jgi:hypothetical protein
VACHFSSTLKQIGPGDRAYAGFEERYLHMLIKYQITNARRRDRCMDMISAAQPVNTPSTSRIF